MWCGGCAGVTHRFGMGWACIICTAGWFGVEPCAGSVRGFEKCEAFGAGRRHRCELWVLNRMWERVRGLGSIARGGGGRMANCGDGEGEVVGPTSGGDERGLNKRRGN